MQKVMIKKCLVYMVNNIFLFILLNCNSNNYLLSKYTLSTNLVLCFFSILMIFNNEYIFCSILNIYQIFNVETRLSQTVETVRDAAVTPDAVKQSINENIENGGYRYIPESNADAVASARAGINRTAEFALIISAELLAGKTYLRRGGRDVYQRIINTFL